MTTTPPRKPRVFVDADALFAGAAGPTDHGASLVVLRMAEIPLIDAVVSQQVIVEAERNLADKLPALHTRAEDPIVVVDHSSSRLMRLKSHGAQQQWKGRTVRMRDEGGMFLPYQPIPK